MARLIVKSPYIKCGGGNSAGGYMRYIATRERVELIQDNRPPTRKQEQLIAKLVKDFPDAKEMGEYGDYQERPTKANASAFISQALEENWSDVQKSDGYMKYIATGQEQHGWAPMVSSVTKMAWSGTRLWRNWRTTQEMCGRTSSP